MKENITDDIMKTFIPLFVYEQEEIKIELYEKMIRVRIGKSLIVSQYKQKNKLFKR